METIDRNSARTIEELRNMARREGWPVTSPWNMAAKFARRDGSITVWCASDDMVRLTYEPETGKVRTRTIKPKNWRF